jgi:hypothetical protein
MTKLYSVTAFRNGVPMVVFMATLDKARLRAKIHRLQGMTTTRPAYCPKFSASVADFRQRGGVVSPSLRDD